MKAVRVVLPLYVGFLISSLLVFFLGNSGLNEYKKLLLVQEKLQENIADLQGIHRRLEGQIAALSSDPEMIRLEARKMGYYPEGVRRIRIEGYSPKEDHFAVGTLIQRKNLSSSSDWVYRLIGYVLPVCLYVYLVFQWFARRKQ